MPRSVKSPSRSNANQKKRKISFALNSDWGRNAAPELKDRISTALLFFLVPFLIFYVQISNQSLRNLVQGEFSSILRSVKEVLILSLSWIGFQVILSLLPDLLGHYFFSYFGYCGGHRRGSTTPAGHNHIYQINGLQAWIITHLLFIGGAWYGYWDLTVIARNWFSLLISANLIGYTVTFLAYLKGLFWPSHPDDNKKTGYFIFDLVMGIELNPRIFSFDLKLFFNGRPGIIGWTMINLSFAAMQYRKFGQITDSMIILNLLQGLYVLDFFWNENWYLHTIDIAHDHFGWMLAWGDCVWLPFMYTLQGAYLSFHRVELGPQWGLIILGLGLFGYLLFRWSNYQRDYFRRREGRCLIWGRQPSYIVCSFETKKGRHQSYLLHSGFWGWARHLNYTGDILLSLAYCLTSGTGSIIPYFYVVYMTILLVIRCYRDEHRCQAKYGQKWTQYCQIVPYRLIPYIY